MRGLLLQIRRVSDGLDYRGRAGDDKETEEMLTGDDRLGVGWERMGESRMTLSFDGTIYGVRNTGEKKRKKEVSLGLLDVRCLGDIPVQRCGEQGNRCIGAQGRGQD